MKESLIKQTLGLALHLSVLPEWQCGGAPSAERIQNERACCTPHCHGRGHDCRRRGLCARGDLSAHADHDDGNALACVYRARDGARGAAVGALTAVAALLLTMLFATPVAGATFVLSFAPTGLALGLLLRHQGGTLRALVGGTLASLLGKAAAGLLILLLFGINPFAMDPAVMQQAMDETLGIYRSLGMTEVQIEETRAAASEVLELFLLMLPALFVGSALIEVGVCYAVMRKVLRRMGVAVTALPPFAQWHLPVVFPYLFAFSLIGIYWGSTREIVLLYQVALNGYVIAFLAGLVQGVALLHFLLLRFRVSPFVRALIYVFILVNGVMTQIISWTGLFDMVYDYRRRIRERQ